jgi:hypothetical protein
MSDLNMFKYYTGNMAIIIDQYGPIFMIYHNMCDGCMDRRMDVHTDRRMSLKGWVEKNRIRNTRSIILFNTERVLANDQ